MDIKVIEKQVDTSYERYLALEKLFYSVINRMADCVLDDLEEDYFTDTEISTFEDLVNERVNAIDEHLESTDPLVFNDALADLIVAHEALRIVVKECVQSVVDMRAQYFPVEMSYSGNFTIWVKAHSREEARSCAENLSHYELTDYMDDYDTEFDVDYVGDGCDDEPSEEVFDAMEY